MPCVNTSSLNLDKVGVMGAKVSVSSHRAGSSESSGYNRFCRRSGLLIPRPQSPQSYANSSAINSCLFCLHRFYQLVVGWERCSIQNSGMYQGWKTGVPFPVAADTIVLWLIVALRIQNVAPQRIQRIEAERPTYSPPFSASRLADRLSYVVMLSLSIP